MLLSGTVLRNGCSMTRIRKSFAGYLASIHFPRLEFRHDSLSAGQQELEFAFAELEEKEDDERLRTALRTKPDPS